MQNNNNDFSKPVTLGLAIRDALSPGFSKGDKLFTQLLMYWPRVVNAEIAACCSPVKLIGGSLRKVSIKAAKQTDTKSDFNKGRILVLRVDKPNALKIQFASKSIIERINTWSGKEYIRGIKIIVKK